MQKINGHFFLHTAKFVLRERRTVFNSAVWLLNHAVVQ